MIADRLPDGYAQQLREEISRGADTLVLAEIGFTEPARDEASGQLAAEALAVTVTVDAAVPPSAYESAPDVPKPKRRQTNPRRPRGRTGVFADGRGTDPDLM